MNRNLLLNEEDVRGKINGYNWEKFILEKVVGNGYFVGQQEVLKPSFYKFPKQTIMKKKTINVNGQPVRILQNGEEDYFCLSDIAKSEKGRAADFIKNYLRNKNTVEFLGLWETMNNKEFYKP